MKAAASWFTLLVLWALIFLPGLGDLEIRGEEWRRTIPGRTMLETGEFLVPYSGGEPYLRKPPLINWTSAASFAAFGDVNEWTARMPSVLVVLAGALLIHAMFQSFLPRSTALVISLITLGSVGMIEKGRIAELEIYYTMFTGVAVVAFIAGALRSMPRWLTWSIVGVSLGLGMLTKGPIHLVFFYSIALGVAFFGKKWKSFFHLGHLWALLLMVGISAAWVYPFALKYGELMGLSGSEIKDYWVAQITSRTSGKSGTSIANYLLRWPKGLVLFLPWILLVPVLWKSKSEIAKGLGEQVGVWKGILFGSFLAAFIILIVPSSSGRYISPLGYPVMLLLGWAASFLTLSPQDAFVKTARKVGLVLLGLGILASLAIPMYKGQFPNYPILTWISWLALAVLGWRLFQMLRIESTTEKFLIKASFAVPIAIAVMVFAGHPLMSQKEDIRGLGMTLARTIEGSESPLYLWNMGEVPYPFYLPSNTREVKRKKDMPNQGLEWILTTDKEWKKNQSRWIERYGAIEKHEEFQGTWGDRQRGKPLHLIQFQNP